MELVHIETQYHALNTAHLDEDELDHELRIRDVVMNGESRSKRERALRNLLKAEKEEKTVSFDYDGIALIDELKCCDGKLQGVKCILEGKKIRKAPDQKFKFKLLHIFFRMKRLKPRAEEEADLNSIATIAGECIRLLNRFYSITSPLPEVREAEITIANESLRQIREEIDERNVNENEEVESNVGQNVEGETRDHESEGSEHVSESIRQVEEEVDSDDVGAVGAVEISSDKENERVAELSEENRRLMVIVGQLVQRIQALEALNAPTLRDRNAPTKQSTPLEQRSVESEKDARQRDDQDFLEWLKSRNGSSLDKEEKVKVPLVPHRTDKTDRTKVEVDRPKTSRLPVHKWSARYDGMDNGRKLNEFLKEVEFNARSEGFTEAELFVSAHHLFTRKARSWFMEVNGNNELGSWENLVRELKSEFLPVDIDYQYERLANARKQGPKEKFQDYYLDMVRIFRSMSRQWDDARKFDVLFRNTRADCRTAMLAANVSSIPKMREFGKKFDSINWQVYARKESRYERPNSQVEEINQQTQYRGGNSGGNGSNNKFSSGYTGGYQGRNFNPNYKPGGKQIPPDRNKTQGGENQPKFQPKPKQNQQSNQNQQRRQDNPKPGPSGTNALQRIVKAYIPIKRGLCFNCHEEGHSFDECERERNIFCEKCGFPGFITKDCPFCESKNAKKTAQ